MQELLILAEEKLKSKIKDLYFKKFNYFGDKIDFCITQNLGILGEVNLLWAEAKKGQDSCILESFIQLIFTIKKEKYNAQQTPKFLGAFDAQKFAFLPYASIQEVFYQNDIDWSVTPSNHKTPQFLSLLTQLKPTLEKEMIVFSYESQSKELSHFIAQNLTTDEINKYEIDKNNFVSVYFKWLEVVKPTLQANWEEMKKKYNVIDADFYLADLLSSEDTTITERLRIILQGDHYRVRHIIGNDEFFKEVWFSDNQEKYHLFWNVYKRPPREEFWDYILERRDLLVSQDIRERTGAFFTPKIWVQKSQEYLAKALGEDWQDEYYIWDCAGGTGNLLAGLTNHRNVFCSTLDHSDVKVVKQRNQMVREIFEDHIFQFDFLNDEFFDEIDDKGNVIVESKVPKKLQEILKNEKKRQKLVIYINPPYAEAPSSKTIVGNHKHKSSVATETMIYKKYMEKIGKGNRELYMQFLARISLDISGCYIGVFSTPKYINSQNSKKFLEYFNPFFLNGFIVPASSFDNVKSDFPIMFAIWKTGEKNTIKSVDLDVFDYFNYFIGRKKIHSMIETKTIKDWLRMYNKEFSTGKYNLGYLVRGAVDFQNNKIIFLTQTPSKAVLDASNANEINENNLMINFIFMAVRYAIPVDWLNNKDQFYFPDSLWEEDKEFQSDCFCFSLFHEKNRVTHKSGINYFIPFTETDVGAKSAFESDFMTRFMQGKIELKSLLGGTRMSDCLVFSQEAEAVFKIGREIFAYYHTQDFSTKPYNVNASLYDIKEFFQGRNDEGEMINIRQVKNTHYKNLMDELADSLNTLAKKLKPKIYEYGFLKE